MENISIQSALLGGALVGVASSVMLLFIGKIAGNSGIIGGIFTLKKDKAYWRLFYIAGMIIGAWLYAIGRGNASITVEASFVQLVIAGLLVGFGTRLGSGCTSGHGICGIARCSKRSIAATAIFMATAIVTVWLLKRF